MTTNLGRGWSPFRLRHSIELMAAGARPFCTFQDLVPEVMRFSPRQSDVMIVAGTVTYKMALAVKRITSKWLSRNG